MHANASPTGSAVDTGATAVSREASRVPSLQEVILLTVVISVILILVLHVISGSFAHQVRENGDNEGYILISRAIRNWDFAGLPVHERRLFWGLPMATAALSTITRIPDAVSLALISWGSLIITVVLSYRLWGPWVTAYFSVINWDWTVRSTVGGSEAPFMALILGTFVAVRRRHWLTAAFLGALAVVVRPVGIFVLVAVGVVLLLQRRPGTLAAAVGISLAIGGLYLLPIAAAFGNPLENYVMYSDSWESDSPLSLPYKGIVVGFQSFSAGGLGPNAITTGVWVILVHVAIVVMIVSARFREYTRRHPVEAIFGILSIAFLIFYNTEGAWLAFRRYAIPAMPLLLIALEGWLPKDHRVPWIVGIAFAPLAAISAFGSAESITAIKRMLGS